MYVTLTAAFKPKGWRSSAPADRTLSRIRTTLQPQLYSANCRPHHFWGYCVARPVWIVLKAALRLKVMEIALVHYDFCRHGVRRGVAACAATARPPKRGPHIPDEILASHAPSNIRGRRHAIGRIEIERCRRSKTSHHRRAYVPFERRPRGSSCFWRLPPAFAQRAEEWVMEHNNNVIARSGPNKTQTSQAPIHGPVL
jgi:hypothetical protein